MGSIDSIPNGRELSDYEVAEIKLGDPSHLKVIMIGGGASGMNMARHMELHMKNYELVIYEKNADIGGTWFENRYPGCACDIPSHNYQFTWEPNPGWSSFYSTSSEIHRYFKDVATKYELYKYIKLEHLVSGATWDEKEGIWRVEIKNLKTGEMIQDWGHILVNGSGVLKYNGYHESREGLHSFEGSLIHSAAWKDEYKLENKRVAVLGCGSSGVQIVPTIQPVVKHLTTFIRTPTWITAGFAQDHAGPGGANFDFSEDQKDEWRRNPDKYLAYRKKIEGELNTRFRFIIADSQEQAEAKQYSTNEMKTKLQNPTLEKHMIPDFAVGCRRPTPGNGYLEALSMENVRVVTDSIQEIVPRGIKLTTGEIIEVDVFICATGFDISFSPRFKLTGRNGKDLATEWKRGPAAYLSVATANFPNYFMYLGPNAPVGHGSVLPIIEHATKYFINFMKKIQTQQIKAVVPKESAIRDFVAHMNEFMKRTAWATACRSWFKNGTIDGPIWALHPGSRIHWFHMLTEPRYEDWEFTYHSQNRFQYLGNGFSVRETPDQDTTRYFDFPEEGYREY